MITILGLEESKEERALALLFKLDARPTEMVLDELAPNTNYTIRIQPALRDGVGCKSQMVTCSTDQDLPGAPLLVTASLNDSTTILVRWRPPSLTNGHVKQYTVYIKKGWVTIQSIQLKIAKMWTKIQKFWEIYWSQRFNPFNWSVFQLKTAKIWPKNQKFWEVYWSKFAKLFVFKVKYFFSWNWLLLLLLLLLLFYRRSRW